MTVVVQTRDRCRICFSLLLRDRSLCCQKSYDLFKRIERRKIASNRLSPFQIKIRNQTVCFHDLIIRYLHTQLHQARNFSNLICHDCSMILLDIEQCSKYLRKTVNQLKIKFNKSNRLRTSSLSATFQKKGSQSTAMIAQEQLPILNSDTDEEFDDIDDEEEIDDEQSDTKLNSSTNLKTSNQSTSPHFKLSSSSSFTGSDSLSGLPNKKTNLNKKKTNHAQCNDKNHNNADAVDVGDDNDDDDDEDGLIKSPPPNVQRQNSADFFHRLQANALNSLSTPNGLLTTASNAIVNPSNIDPNRNDRSPHADTLMNTFATIQRNFLMQLFNDPVAAAQAAAAMVSAAQVKTNLASKSLTSSNNKQLGSGRKRKSTPEKRVVTNHGSSNNGDVSPTAEQESNEQNHLLDSTDHPLELTLKGTTSRLSSPAKITPDIHNIMKSKLENGSPTYHQNYINQHQTIDEDRKDGMILNDSSLSVSPSLMRHPTSYSKRQKVPTANQLDYTNNLKINLSKTSTSDLLSPNNQSTLCDDNNANQQQKQQRKLDPRTCTECGKVLFSDKTLLLHCQTHAKNEKQCWICGINDDDIKKHINTEHGNQKFTNTGFKCQHCEKSFSAFSELETHVREHSKKKPFECPICHKRFGQQGNLSCHLRIHSGVKPFTCAHCGKAFRHSNSLRRHARTVHSASRGLSMSPGAVGAISASPSLRLASATASNSMVAMANDMHHLSASETFEDSASGLMIQSDEAESLQGPPSTSTTGPTSPSISNAQIDSDSHEQSGTG